MSQDTQWHLSKSVPITFIFAILLQTIALIWFVATLRNDIDNALRNDIRQDTKITSLETIVHKQEVTMGRMDENIKAIRQAVEKMANQ